MFFKSKNGDRKYKSSDFADYFSTLVTTGVFAEQLNSLQVETSNNNMSSIVKPGKAFIKGYYLENDEDLTLIHDIESTAGIDRIDLIICKMSIEDRGISIEVKKGSPGESPVAPEVIQNEEIYELVLAEIYITGGNTGISNDKVSDKRCFAKTRYMETFDDENNLIKYKKQVVTQDSKGIATAVHYIRDNNTKAITQEASNEDSKGNYQTIVEKFYMPDGVTVYKTYTYTITYSDKGLILTQSRVVS